MALVQVAADDFTRADGALGGSFTAVTENANGGVTIVSNQAKCDGTSAARDGIYRYDGPETFADDQYVEFTVVSRLQ